MADDRPKAGVSAGPSALLGFGESEEGCSDAREEDVHELHLTAARDAIDLEVARASAAFSEHASPAEQEEILAASERLAQACATLRSINFLRSIG